MPKLGRAGTGQTGSWVPNSERPEIWSGRGEGKMLMLSYLLSYPPGVPSRTHQAVKTSLLVNEWEKEEGTVYGNPTARP